MIRSLKTNFIPILIFTFSLIMRLGFLRNGAFDLDSLNLALQAQRSLDTFSLHNLYGTGYPLTVLLTCLFIAFLKIFAITDPVIGGHVMSAFFGTLSVYVFYFFVKKLFNEQMAVIASLLLSLCPFFFDISLFGMSHTPTIFFFLLSLLWLTEYKLSSKKKYLVWAAIAIGLSGSSRLQDITSTFWAISFFIFLNKEHNIDLSLSRFVDAVTFWLIGFMIIVGFHSIFFLNPQLHYLEQLKTYFQTGSILRKTLLTTLYLNYSYLWYNFSLPGILMQAVGFLWMIKDKRHLALFLLLWFLIPFILYANLTNSAPRFYCIFLGAPILFESYFLFQIISKNSRYIFPAIVLFGLAIYLPMQNAMPKIKFLHHHASIPDFARWIKEKTENNAYIITADEGMFIEYYGQRKVLGRLENMKNPSEKSLNNYKKQLDAMLEQNIPVYITFTGVLSYDSTLRYSNFLNQNYSLIEIGRFDNYVSWHKSPFLNDPFTNGLLRIEKK